MNHMKKCCRIVGYPLAFIGVVIQGVSICTTVSCFIPGIIMTIIGMILPWSTEGYC